MIMYVYDRRWLDKGQTNPLYPKHPGEEVDSFYVERKHTIATIALFIRKRAKGRKVKLLHLFAHGTSGWLEMGKGLDVFSAHQMHTVRDLLAPNARVELHGCNVASDTALTCTGTDKPNSVGREMLKALAQALKCPVTAALDCQYEDVMCNFEGTTVTVSP